LPGELREIATIEGVYPVCSAFLRTRQVEHIIGFAADNVVSSKLQSKFAVFFADQSDSFVNAPVPVR